MENSILGKVLWIGMIVTLLQPPLALAQTLGSGPELVNPIDIERSRSEGVVYVADVGDETLKEVNVLSGARRIILDYSAYTSNFKDMVFSEAENALVILTGDDEIFVVSLVDYSVRKLTYTTPTVLQTIAKRVVTNIIASLDGRFVYFMEGWNDDQIVPRESLYDFAALLRITLATGEVTPMRREPEIVNGKPLLTGEYPRFRYPGSVAQAYRLALRTDGGIHILKQDLAAYNYHWTSFIVDAETLETEIKYYDEQYQNVRSITAILEDDTFIYLTDPRLSSILRLDRDNPGFFEDRIFSGRENKVMGNLVGSGPQLVSPNGLVFLPSGELGVLDTFHNAVIAVDTETGDRRLISGTIRPSELNTRDPISEYSSDSFCERSAWDNLSVLRQRLTELNWELDDAYPQISCPVFTELFHPALDGNATLDELVKPSGYIDFLKKSVEMPGGTGNAVSLARYYIRELEKPEEITRIYNTIHSVPGYASGTLLDFLHFHRSKPYWDDDDRERYDSGERMIRRFGGLTQAELEASP